MFRLKLIGAFSRSHKRLLKYRIAVIFEIRTFCAVFEVDLEPRNFSASKSLFTVELWSNEPLSLKIKSAKCFNPRKCSASKITLYMVVM